MSGHGCVAAPPNGHATSSCTLPKIEAASIFVRLRLALPSPQAVPICYFGRPFREPGRPAIHPEVRVPQLEPCHQPAEVTSPDHPRAQICGYRKFDLGRSHRGSSRSCQSDTRGTASEAIWCLREPHAHGAAARNLYYK